MKQQPGLALLAGFGALMVGAANAQTPVSSAAADATAELSEVMVTGSRVISNGNNSPTPVTVVTMEDLQTTHPSRVFESLLDIPAFAGSRGGVASVPSGNRATSNQISALNLRGLGPVRTLVLYDGHRVPATESDGFVDANIIPQMLLERVDVVTGGASAVYGSDAIGGVVNFISNRRFNGLKVDIQSGTSELHDAGTYQVGAAFGMDLFGGRGHIEGSVQALHDDGILHRTDRSQFLGRWTIQGNGCPGGAGSAGCLPFFLVDNATNSTWTYGGKIGGPANNPLLNYQFASNGVLAKFVPGSTAGLPSGSLVQIGGDGIWDTSASLKQKQSIDQGFGRFDFDITDDLHYFASAAATMDHAFNFYGNANSQTLVIRSSNAFLAPVYQQQMLAANISTFTYWKKYGLSSLIPPSPVDFYTHTLYVNTGLEGKLGAYKWEASYTHADVNLESRSNYTLNNGPFFAALDAVLDPATNRIVCWVSTTSFASLYPGCVPINLFGPNSESQQAVDYVRKRGIAFTKMPTDDVSGSFTGAPFSNWAGPVNMALSGEWRKQSMEIISDKPTIDYAPLDCTGLRDNCITRTATNIGSPAFNGGVAPRPPVSMTVIEGALEADVPLLKDLPLAQSANLNLAYRYAKYSAKGNPDITAAELSKTFTANTWKAGLDWHFNDVVTLRATRSRDIRAPNLSELFQSNGITFTNNIIDYLTGSNLTGTGALPQVVNGGNANLKPEVAATTTVGLVLKPTPNLSLAVDAFDIKVTDFIASINGATQAFQNACYAGNAYYCTLQQRPGPLTDTSKANAATRWYTVPANVAELSTRGIDLEANYQTRFVGRSLSLRGLVTYQPHVLFTQAGQATVLDFAAALGTPVAYATGAVTRMTAYARYKLSDKLSFDWQAIWRGRLHQSPDPTLTELPSAGAPSVAFSNLTLSYNLAAPSAGTANVYLNVQNVFNQPAPIAASYVDQASPGISGGYVPGDDPTGRYFRVGMRLKW
jgi:outer membrane receptor protein involved in Fe transport